MRYPILSSVSLAVLLSSCGQHNAIKEYCKNIKPERMTSAQVASLKIAPDSKFVREEVQRIVACYNASRSYKIIGDAKLRRVKMYNGRKVFVFSAEKATDVVLVFYFKDNYAYYMQYYGGW